jgi:hypothetical protein
MPDAAFICLTGGEEENSPGGNTVIDCLAGNYANPTIITFEIFSLTIPRILAYYLAVPQNESALEIYVDRLLP